MINFVKILLFTLFLSVNVNGRDIGRSPVLTIHNQSQVLENDEFKNRNTNGEDYKLLYSKSLKDVHVSWNETFFGFRAPGYEINITELPQRGPLLRDPKSKDFMYPDDPGSSVITLRRGEHVEVGCEINIRELPQRGPLLRDPKSKDFMYPDHPGSSVITLRRGEHVEVDCPGSALLVNGHQTGEITDAVCVSGTTFRVLGEGVDVGDLLCRRRITSVAQCTEDRCFGGRGREIEIGFKFTDGHFIQLMTACFEERYREVFYSKFHMHHRIGDQNTGGTRPSWTEGSFYNLEIRLNNIYPNAAQRAQINRQIGLSDEDTKYIKPTGNHYLAKGHLTARSDMFSYAHQEATFWYVNSVPQWQTFNGFNWAYLEANVRQLSARMRMDFEIITGGYGHASLPHESSGEPVQLVLYVDDNDNKAIPVPEIFYKVIYSPTKKQGVVIVGINNPYQTDIESSIYCSDVADKLSWLTFNRTRLDRGYIYACTIDEFRKLIPELPKYQVRSILK